MKYVNFTGWILVFLMAGIALLAIEILRLLWRLIVWCFNHSLLIGLCFGIYANVYFINQGKYIHAIDTLLLMIVLAITHLAEKVSELNRER
jgi:hypothetical protein